MACALALNKAGPAEARGGKSTAVCMSSLQGPVTLGAGTPFLLLLAETGLCLCVVCFHFSSAGLAFPCKTLVGTS